MAIKFYHSKELQFKIEEIVEKLNMQHVDMSRVRCIKSYGSKAKRTIARCYGLCKVWQTALGLKGHYIIEVISEQFDKMSKEEQEKTLIHELLHIPFNMGGGFKHHRNYVTKRRVDKLYKEYKEKKNEIIFS